MQIQRQIKKLLNSRSFGPLVFWAAALVFLLFLLHVIIPPRPAPEGANETDISRFHSDIWKPFWSEDENGLMQPANRDLCGNQFRAKKPANVRRIVLVGGSMARNLGLSRHLQPFLDELARANPDRKVEFIDSAIPGYDSFRVRRVLDEMLDYSPDTVIIMCGNNEFYHKGLGRLARIFHVLGRIRPLDRLILRASGKEERPRSIEERLCGYQSNIRAMARAAKRRGARVLLCTMAGNSSEFAPVDDFPADENFIRASIAFWRGRNEEARKRILAYIRQNPESAPGYFLFGRVLTALGRKSRARMFFNAAMNLDYGNQSRSCPAANSVLRATASQEGTDIIDLEAEVEKLRDAGANDRDIFTDNCHFRESARPIVFNALLAALCPDARPLPEDAAAQPEPMRHLFEWFAADCVKTEDKLLSEYAFSKFRLVFLAVGADGIDAFICDREKLAAGMRDFTDFDEDDEDAWDRLHLHMGEAFRRAGELESADRYFSRLQAGDMESAQLSVCMAMLADAKEQWEAAVLYTEKAVKTATNAFLPTARIFRRVFRRDEK